jgi:hypothetical protein
MKGLGSRRRQRPAALADCWPRTQPGTALQADAAAEDERDTGKLGSTDGPASGGIAKFAKEFW